MSNSKQQGTAIVTVMLVLAIITVVATSLMVSQRIDIRRMQQIVIANQNYHYAEGVLYWAIGLIKQDEQAPIENLADKEEWLRTLSVPSSPNNPAAINGQLLRLEQRYNVNGINQGDMANAVLTYLKENFPELGDKGATEFMRALNNWVQDSKEKKDDSLNNEVQALSEQAQDLDAGYLKLTPPYSVPHMPMVSPSELRLLLDVDAEFYNKLHAKFVAVPPSRNANPNSTDLNTYYLLQADVKLADQTLRVYSVLQRVVDNNGMAKVIVLYEARGTL